MNSHGTSHGRLRQVAFTGGTDHACAAGGASRANAGYDLSLWQIAMADNTQSGSPWLCARSSPRTTAAGENRPEKLRRHPPNWFEKVTSPPNIRNSSWAVDCQAPPCLPANNRSASLNPAHARSAKCECGRNIIVDDPPLAFARLCQTARWAYQAQQRHTAQYLSNRHINSSLNLISVHASKRCILSNTDVRPESFAS